MPPRTAPPRRAPGARHPSPPRRRPAGRTTMTEPLLSVQDLSVSYGRVHAVRGVSFDVAAGSLVTLVGANGAGKSSIINAISGIVRPSGGKVVFEGAEITRTRSHRLVPR